jgi:hypothetical protein
MPTFEDRERAFETKFAHDEEFRFLVAARRDKLFAAQVAEQIGLPVQAGRDLTTAVLALRDGPGHDQALLGYMAGLLAEHGRGGEAAKLAALLEECGARALQQLLASPPAH